MTRRLRTTPDDATPETLLDPRRPVAADTALSVVDASTIGGGVGADEAEQAQREPISRAEHARIKRRVARSGGGVRNLEPYESRAGSPGRRRNRT